MELKSKLEAVQGHGIGIGTLLTLEEGGRKKSPYETGVSLRAPPNSARDSKSNESIQSEPDPRIRQALQARLPPLAQKGKTEAVVSAGIEQGSGDFFQGPGEEEEEEEFQFQDTPLLKKRLGKKPRWRLVTGVLGSLASRDLRHFQTNHT